MKLTCYALRPCPLPIVCAKPVRAWMDRITDRGAYRCLPLVIGNSYGWEILSPCRFMVAWNGGDSAADLVVKGEDDFPIEQYVTSHFAYGVFTIQTTYLFRTEPGWDLMATGPFNYVNDGITPLTGIVETDWSPYPFTMNWRMTRPGAVMFEKDEPLCLIVPVMKGMLEQVQPEIRSIDDAPELQMQMNDWSSRRREFVQKLHDGDPEVMKQSWQRDYFLGRLPDGQPIEHHTQRIRLHDPVDLRFKEEKNTDVDGE